MRNENKKDTQTVSGGFSLSRTTFSFDFDAFCNSVFSVSFVYHECPSLEYLS